MLAHGAVLRKSLFSAGQLIAIARDFRNAGLTAQEVAVMGYAQKIARDASGVTAEDIAELRRLGLSDAEVFDVALVATARCFFSKTLDAVGAEPDSAYLQLEPELRAELAKGRPFG